MLSSNDVILLTETFSKFFILTSAQMLLDSVIEILQADSSDDEEFFDAFGKHWIFAFIETTLCHVLPVHSLSL